MNTELKGRLTLWNMKISLNCQITYIWHKCILYSSKITLRHVFKVTTSCNSSQVPEKERGYNRGGEGGHAGIYLKTWNFRFKYYAKIRKWIASSWNCSWVCILNLSIDVNFDFFNKKRNYSARGNFITKIALSAWRHKWCIYYDIYFSIYLRFWKKQNLQLFIWHSSIYRQKHVCLG